ncbi:LytTR family DNA-binding domain-containing protein [Paenibacillus sp. J2TS4]|uniref:LytTR family DNA-binding domain-containing protein n=1 Tax=Paenibacillus sp. J2TS4 TaxID=2807194 RepID=UPI001B09FDB7|nr:LytTR family DNA-binding domain-containing protein [Paenibacillus sp. J2TS4]GIP32988.1 hypothetical protein J2TS4_21980 [Paenibacillus sp. J2TS4]
MRVLKNDGSSCEIQEEEILYFTNHRNTIYVHTTDGEYVLPTTLSDLHAAYNHSGFERLDRSNVVHLKNVAGYDSERKIVYFKESQTFATVSESNEKRIKRYLEARKKSST